MGMFTAVPGIRRQVDRDIPSLLPSVNGALAGSDGAAEESADLLVCRPA